MAVARHSRALKGTRFEREGPQDRRESQSKAASRAHQRGGAKAARVRPRSSLAKVPWTSVKDAFRKACKIPPVPSQTCGR